tara:strand:+ start:937 stop:3222 length:2286 start_codon:yes stop_codon:yes gene_type:complete
MKIIKKEILGLVLMLISLLSFISILVYDTSEQPSGIDESQVVNILGYFGIYVGYYQYVVLGYFSIFISFILSVIGYALFSNRPIAKFYKLIIYLFVCSLWLSTLFSLFGYNHLSGIVGFSIFTFLNDIFGSFGSAAIMLILFVSLLILIFQISIYDNTSNLGSFLFKKLKILYNSILSFSKNKIKFKKYIKIDKKEEDNIEELNTPTINVVEELDSEKIIDNSKEFDEESDDLKIEEPIDEDNEINNNDNDEESILIEDEIDIEKGDYDAKIAKENKYLSYKLPNSNFLDDPIEVVNHDETYLKDKADQLSYALNSFGVSGNIVKISPGPVITLFEIEPAEGVRVNKFTNLSEDLSRIMGGKRVRIIAPIPGSKSVGVELPNESPSIVYLKSIINSRKYVDNKSKLKIALGKTTTGDAFFFELNKMPHLLVAGATGAGKSVCINTIIISILYNAKPDEVKFILMDPKKVELTTYKSLVGYHLITAKKLDEYVMTTSENSVSILNSAINEMERRFQVFSDVRVRNIDEYHQKKNLDSSLENIPYVVVIIDELADLMMTSGRAIEEPITRLAQKARAVGMHLIVATQRPSVDVITGLIKSNFPARISFQVSSKIDSRTIIDQMGAEKLLGRGDMLFLLPGSASPIRVHNAYITLDEIEKVMAHITSQPKPEEIKLPEIKKMDSNADFDISGDQDELLKDAAILVVDAQQASVSLLQRKFRIGYSRAGRLIDELESLGIVSGYSGSKAREVLVDHAYITEIFGD